MSVEGISRETRVVVSDRQVSTGADGESVILNFDEGVYYGLDKVGARIWELVQQPTTVSQLADQLAAEYEVEAERCERDVKDLLSELADAGLVAITAD